MCVTYCKVIILYKAKEEVSRADSVVQ